LGVEGEERRFADSQAVAFLAVGLDGGFEAVGVEVAGEAEGVQVEGGYLRLPAAVIDRSVQPR